LVEGAATVGALLLAGALRVRLLVVVSDHRSGVAGGVRVAVALIARSELDRVVVGADVRDHAAAVLELLTRVAVTVRGRLAVPLPLIARPVLRVATTRLRTAALLAVFLVAGVDRVGALLLARALR